LGRGCVDKRLLYGCLVVLLTLAATEIAGHFHWLAGVENAQYDIWHQMAAVRYTPAHVVIVSIDEQTRLEHQDEPLVFWAPHFARVIEVLRKAEARVIGLDFLFSISAEAWLKKLDLPAGKSRTFDLELRRQFAAGKVILAGGMMADEQGHSKILLPIQDYYFSLPRQLDDVGLTNFYNDADGVVRRFVSALSDAEGEIWPTFAALLTQRAAAGDMPKASQAQSYIGFAGPPGTFPRLSFRRLLSPEADLDQNLKGLKGKVVIVALETRMQDIHLTPYARSFLNWGPLMMSGPEVHANIVETMLTGRAPRAVPAPLRLAVLVLVLAAGTCCFFHFSPWRGVGAGLLLAFLCLVLAYVLFLNDLILPVGNLELGLVLSFLGVLGVRLMGAERTRQRLRQVFARYVADEVVDRIMASGKLPDLGGEALTVTVLFADIRNFTAISERLSAHEVVEMLNAYFSSICEPILEYGGTVDKFIGDAVMAVFGAPAPQPDHARRALSTALAMAARVGDFQAWMAGRFAGRGLPEFNVGIGLHTGEAVVGNIGSPKRLEYTAIGDTVNIASRLESLTKELGWTIIASEQVIAASGLGVITGRRLESRLRGREEPVWVYELMGLQ
jgi:adenylate cyclase